MRIERLDHLVLAVCDIERSVAFYIGVLGLERYIFGERRTALRSRHGSTPTTRVIVRCSGPFSFDHGTTGFGRWGGKSTCE